jgi:release factor glutamine methyltransferase
MTANAWLKHAQQQLETAGIGTARLDALILLEDSTRIDRAKLLADPETKLTAAQQAKLTKLLRRRALHEPLSYIRGFTEFYGRQFVITPAVLEPRPESETMIELLLGLRKAGSTDPKSPNLSQIDWDNVHIADVGAGSGALGITAQLELPGAKIDILEIDPAALRVAKTNVDLFTLPIAAIRSDLLAQGGGSYDILLCNLPYVPDDYHINKAAAREPRLAIFGGPDGLDIYRKLFNQVVGLPKRPLFILTESLPPQHEHLQTIAEAAGYQLLKTEDFIQVFGLV